jgi:hypothetical protein
MRGVVVLFFFFFPVLEDWLPQCVSQAICTYGALRVEASTNGWFVCFRPCKALLAASFPNVFITPHCMSHGRHLEAHTC